MFIACEVCYFVSADVRVFKLHLFGKKHKQLEHQKRKREIKSLDRDLCSEDYSCGICENVFGGFISYAQHEKERHNCDTFYIQTIRDEPEMLEGARSGNRFQYNDDDITKEILGRKHLSRPGGLYRSESHSSRMNSNCRENRQFGPQNLNKTNLMTIRTLGPVRWVEKNPTAVQERKMQKFEDTKVCGGSDSFAQQYSTSESHKKHAKLNELRKQLTDMKLLESKDDFSSSDDKENYDLPSYDPERLKAYLESETPMKCKGCGSKLMKHVKELKDDSSSSEDKEKCGLAFPDSERLKAFIKSKTPKSIECKGCRDKSMKRMEELMELKNDSSSSEGNQEKCSLAFPDPEHLKAQKIKSEKYKPVEFKACKDKSMKHMKMLKEKEDKENYRFPVSDPERLKAYIEGQKSVKCKGCKDKLMKRMKELKDGSSSSDEKEKCGWAFPDPEGLKDFIENMPLSISKELMDLEDSSSPENEESTKVLTCVVCSLSFSSLEELGAHINSNKHQKAMKIKKSHSKKDEDILECTGDHITLEDSVVPVTKTEKNSPGASGEQTNLEDREKPLSENEKNFLVELESTDKIGQADKLSSKKD